MTPPHPARAHAIAPPAPSAPSAPSASPLERTFVAADGRRWRVREHAVRAPDGDVHRRLLVFECRHVLRWLRDYPPDWSRRSDAELERLSGRV